MCYVCEDVNGKVVKILRGGRERVVCISGRDGYSDTLSRVFDIMMTMIRLKTIFVSNVPESRGRTWTRITALS